MVFLAYVGYNYLGKPVNDEEVMITKEGYLETEISNGDVHDGSKNDYRSPLPSNCGVSVPGIQEMAKVKQKKRGVEYARKSQQKNSHNIDLQPFQRP